MAGTTILIDIDNTLAQTQQAYIAYANSRSGTKFSFEGITTEFTDNIDDPFEAFVREYLDSDKYMDTVEAILPYEGICEAFRLLHTNGFRLCIATSRIENWHQPTVRWLDRHALLPYVDQVYLRTSDISSLDFKEQVAIATRAAIAFDDSFATAKVLPSVSKYYLIDQPWNQKLQPLSHMVRVRTFADGVNQLLAYS